MKRKTFRSFADLNDNASVTRRNLLLGMAGLSVVTSGAARLLASGPAWAEEKLACTKSTLTEDGLHNQPWFIQNSFLDLMEEAQAAKEAGKRFAIVLEQKGCPYCKKMHEVNFMQPEICDFVRRHFAILQLNLKGSREVTDFDGEVLPERDWRLKYKAYYTPIILFFDDNLENLKKRPPLKRVVARMDGPKDPDMFLEYFRFVWDRGYEKGSFMQYVKERAKKSG